MTSQDTNSTTSKTEQPVLDKLDTAAASELDKTLTSAAMSPTSPRAEKDAKRAMSATQAWKPALDRRQSWNDQEYKRELQMSNIDSVRTGPGFTERKC